MQRWQNSHYLGSNPFKPLLIKDLCCIIIRMNQKYIQILNNLKSKKRLTKLIENWKRMSSFDELNISRQ